MINEKDKEISELKENLNKKIVEYEKSTEERNNGFEEMNKCERQLNYKISKQKNEFNKVRNEIKDIEKMEIDEPEMRENNEEQILTVI